MAAHSGDAADLREEPMGELVKQLADQTSTLVKQELELAKAEMTQKGREAGKAGGLFGGAGAVALLAAGTLTACVVLLLDEVMDSWLAALIVTVAYAAIAGVLALQGRKRVQHATPPMPEQTVESVKEDVAWAKTRRRSAGT